MEHLELLQPESPSRAKCVKSGEKINARSGLPGPLDVHHGDLIQAERALELATWVIT